MNYNDYSILSDNEYLKIAEQYKNQNQTTPNCSLEKAFELIETCKNSLQMSNNFKNYKIKNELKNHYQTLYRLSNNLKLTFSLKTNNNKVFTDFNIFTYISNLIIIQNNLNNWLKLENNSKYGILIINIKNEINNLIISILDILSKSNIIFFKFM